MTSTDIQAALNIDLTDPNGQALATSLISSAVAYVEAVLGDPLEERAGTEYFEGGLSRLWLSTGAPVSKPGSLQLRRGDLPFPCRGLRYIRRSAVAMDGGWIAGHQQRRDVGL